MTRHGRFRRPFGLLPALPATVVLPLTLLAALRPIPSALADDAPTSVPGQTHAAGDINIRDAWMQIIRPERRIAGAYFTIENRGTDTHMLTGVTATACQNLFAHHTEQESTPETAELFTRLALPAQTILVFPPGGYHLICQGYDGTVQPGRSIPVTFHFLGGTTRTVAFEIRPTPDTADIAP
ncbi:copper chaperone PCu(A)C [Gluconacetobacter tumulisoli]|uniref:Copper chaperone PCu(A)C n=1 Tax=Gluconacetobacter tumulisoli TaxID=1286189 RepID=A0A7W4PN87_9PROT|nr:copper chaperone PCu(A)C [Gluconacetobacter tumulisoli]MBB2202404.1 copper chaperone PCu(A)C [Gluconacetobacter tumulisoli]